MTDDIYNKIKQAYDNHLVPRQVAQELHVSIKDVNRIYNELQRKDDNRVFSERENAYWAHKIAVAACRPISEPSVYQGIKNTKSFPQGISLWGNGDYTFSHVDTHNPSLVGGSHGGITDQEIKTVAKPKKKKTDDNTNTKIHEEIPIRD